jgi:hypothetical protein
MEMAPTGHPPTTSPTHLSSSAGTGFAGTCDFLSTTLKTFGQVGAQFPDPMQASLSTLAFMIHTSLIIFTTICQNTPPFNSLPFMGGDKGENDMLTLLITDTR